MKGDNNSITCRIDNARTEELGGLIEAAINQTQKTAERREDDEYCMAVDPGNERLALQMRNSLKREGYEFNIKRDGKGYLFTIYGDLRVWFEKLYAEQSPLLKSMGLSPA